MIKPVRTTRTTNIATLKAVSMLVALLFCGVPLLSGTQLNASTWECGERSNLPQEGKNYCAAGDFRQSEINLQKVLAALLTKHKTAYGDSNALRSAQTAFEDYRGNQCNAENKRIASEPYHLMIVAQCKTRLTNIRINELTRMLEKNP